MFKKLQGFFAASKEAINNLLKKPITVDFPNDNVLTPDNFRGVPKLEPENCKLCMRCERACPTEAIKIEKVDDTNYQFIIDLGRCCYCQECEINCNFDAIELTSEWLTSQLGRDELKQKYIVTK